MKLVTFKTDRQRFGALLDDSSEVLDFTAAGVPEPATHSDWFDLDGPSLKAALTLDVSGRADELRSKGAIVPRADVHICAPVPRPGKLICIGLNYRDHAAESGMDIPEQPICFSKFPSSVVGPGDPVVIPHGSEQVDYEAELAFVIGRKAKQVEKQDALDFVLGYTNLNDVSARDFQFADGQWQRGKSCDTFAPMGPYIATKDEIPNPHTLPIKLHYDGETLQDSATSQLIFDIPALIEFLSTTITLEPGDVIATGTPPGVGFARKPPIYLEAGRSMTVEIEGLGQLTNPIRSAHDSR